MVSFPLTHKGSFSKVLPIKSNVLSKNQQPIEKNLARLRSNGGDNINGNHSSPRSRTRSLISPTGLGSHTNSCWGLRHYYLDAGEADVSRRLEPACPPCTIRRTASTIPCNSISQCLDLPRRVRHTAKQRMGSRRLTRLSQSRYPSFHNPLTSMATKDGKRVMKGIASTSKKTASA